eukprot:362672-Chlamydomonas_euryale.AAC.4
MGPEALASPLVSTAPQESGCKEGGVMSPAAALGLTYVERLRQAGYIWEVTEVDGKPAPKPVAATTPMLLQTNA